MCTGISDSLAYTFNNDYLLKLKNAWWNVLSFECSQGGFCIQTCIAFEQSVTIEYTYKMIFHLKVLFANGLISVLEWIYITYSILMLTP